MEGPRTSAWMPTVLAARERLLYDLDVLLVEDVDRFMSPSRAGRGYAGWFSATSTVCSSV